MPTFSGRLQYLNSDGSAAQAGPSRKIPELRRLRASFVGRAIHSSPETWQKQFEEILQKI